MSPRDELFAQAYVMSGNAADAYRKAGGKGKNADVMGSKWLVKVGIASRIAELRAEQEKKAGISRDQLREWYERILTATPGDASDDSDICEQVMTKMGPFTKICDKMAAAAALAKLCGYNEPEKSSVDVNVKAKGLLDFIGRRKR